MKKKIPLTTPEMVAERATAAAKAARRLAGKSDYGFNAANAEAAAKLAVNYAKNPKPKSSPSVVLANTKRALRGVEDFLCRAQSGERFETVEEYHNGRKMEIVRLVKPKLHRPDGRWGIAREGFDLLAECRETLGDSPDARECEKQFRFIADWAYDAEDAKALFAVVEPIWDRLMKRARAAEKKAA